MPLQPVSFLSAEPGGPVLEGVLSLPEGPSVFPGVVVCHPHPQRGGTMDNNVVDAVCGALQAIGVGTLRFNFRGVGGSGGQYTGGPGEEEDARGALACLAGAPGTDRTRIGLAGYSFGARIAMAVAAKDHHLAGLAVISGTGQGLAASGDLASSPCPKLFICGDRDTNVNAEQLQAFVDAMPEPKELRIVPGVDHFWWGSEGLLGEVVAGFFSRKFA